MIRYFLTLEAIAAGCRFEAPRRGDAGYDIYAAEKTIVFNHAAPQLGEIALNHWTKVPTGLHLRIPTGKMGLIKDRSSMANQGLWTHAGVIDESYTGEVLILIENAGSSPYIIDAGDKIAQMVIVDCYTKEPEEVQLVTDLGETERGEKGFGSTGK